MCLRKKVDINRNKIVLFKVLYIFYHVLSTVPLATHMKLMHIKYLFTSKIQRYCVLCQFFI